MAGSRPMRGSAATSASCWGPRPRSFAEARIDNRAALCRELGLTADATDAAVIARAYRRWGEDCPARIEGSYAFALWDAGRRRLLCARDLMGIRPLCYRTDGTTLRFAQSPAALADGANGRCVRVEAVADFLYGRVLDAEETWFAGVRRLLDKCPADAAGNPALEGLIAAALDDLEAAAAVGGAA